MAEQEPITLVKIVLLICTIFYLGFQALGWTCIFYDSLYETRDCIFQMKGHRVCQGWTQQQYENEKNQCVELSDSDCDDLLQVQRSIYYVLLASFAPLAIICVLCLCSGIGGFIYNCWVPFLLIIAQIVAPVYLFMQTYYLWNIKVNTTSGVPIHIEVALRWKIIGLGILYISTLPFYYYLKKYLVWIYKSPRSSLTQQICDILTKFFRLWGMVAVASYIAFQIISWLCYVQDNLYETQDCQFTMTGKKQCNGQIQSESNSCAQVNDTDCKTLNELREAYLTILKFSYLPVAIGIGVIFLSRNNVSKLELIIIIILCMISCLHSIASSIFLFFGANMLNNIDIKTTSGVMIIISPSLLQKLIISGCLMLVICLVDQYWFNQLTNYQIEPNQLHYKKSFI